MKKFWMVAVVALGLVPSVPRIGVAVAQTAAPEPTRATNGPAGTVERAHAGIAVDGSRAATRTSDTFKKTQTYTNGDGQLSAKTHIQTTGPVTSTSQ